MPRGTNSDRPFGWNFDGLKKKLTCENDCVSSQFFCRQMEQESKRPRRACRDSTPAYFHNDEELMPKAEELEDKSDGEESYSESDSQTEPSQQEDTSDYKEGESSSEENEDRDEEE